MTASGAKALRIAAGILAANIFGALVTAIFAGLVFAANASGRSGLVSSFLIFGIYPSLALVPMGMGVVAAYVWRTASLSAACRKAVRFISPKACRCPSKARFIRLLW